jgi:hypothetical protein
MSDKVHADCTEIIKYAGQLTKIGSGKKTQLPIMAALTGAQPLNQMSELSYNSFTKPATTDTAGQFQEGLLVAGYLADNVAAFQKFIPDAANGIQCCAQQAQGVGQILLATDGDSAGEIDAEDVSAALAFASADPNAKLPSGVPKDMFKGGTFADTQVQTMSNQPEALSDPNSQFAKTYTEPGANLTTTTYLDGSMRVVSAYTTSNADGTYTNHSTTTVYDENGKEVKNGGQTEETTYGSGYNTKVRHEGNTTVETTTYDNGAVDMKTTTQDGSGNPRVTTAHTDAPDAPAPRDDGPLQTWEQQNHAPDGSKDGDVYAGY